jgi:hypothetical protein
LEIAKKADLLIQPYRSQPCRFSSSGKRI